MKRNNIIEVLFSDEEMQMLKDNALLFGMGRAEYLRWIMYQYEMLSGNIVNKIKLNGIKESEDGLDN